MSQHDEASAGAVMPRKGEVEQLITSKFKERIRFQAKLRKMFLACMYTNVELEELRNIYNSYDKPTYGKYRTDTGEIIEGEWLMKKDDKGNLKYGYIHTTDGRDIKLTSGWKVLRWVNQGKIGEQISDENKPKTGFGLPYSKKMLMWEYQIKEHHFKELVSELNWMVSEITKLGFSKKQIDDIKHNGKYITDWKKLEKMEEDWVKNNVDYSEIE